MIASIALVLLLISFLIVGYLSAGKAVYSESRLVALCYFLGARARFALAVMTFVWWVIFIL